MHTGFYRDLIVFPQNSADKMEIDRICHDCAPDASYGRKFS